MNAMNLIRNYSEEEFQKTVLEIFRFQAENTLVYRDYLQKIHCDISKVKTLSQIPFLPISLFKSHKIITENTDYQAVFKSSGTTAFNRSEHLIVSPKLYEESFTKGFEWFFGDIKDYTILALLPSYLEQKNSSLVYMVNHLIEKSENAESGFYLHNYHDLIEKLQKLDYSGKKTLLIGVSYALLDLIDIKNFQLKNTLIMETGGMKGRRQELIKSELHDLLKRGFGVHNILSEYGMTELLSQAYSIDNEQFKTVPWMKILIREVEDPFSYLPYEKTGGINVIDFANLYSCSFIETQDLGKTYSDGSFEVLGRFDHSDIRGCNLMLS